MKFKVFALSILSASLAFGADCLKSKGSTDFNSCFNSQNLKWALPAPQQITPEMIMKGPQVEPALTQAEQESGTIFCRYFFHQFSSPGSAKFKCARTTQNGILLDEKGVPVPAAKNVSTDQMAIKVTIDGQTKTLDEGYLLDERNQPIWTKNKKGKVELVQADEIKVKYFVDIDDPAKMDERKNLEFPFAGEMLNFSNVFVSPIDISNPRWNEVFTEVASSRLLWALGYPADVMIPLKKVVCFGCDPHPKVQKNINPRQISIFNYPVIERKMPGSKLGDFFNMNTIVARNYPNWSPQVKNDFEGLALAAQLMAYHSFIDLQNRLQCQAGSLDKKTGVCSAPMPMMQDVGSTWAGKVSMLKIIGMGLNDNPRGFLHIYQKGSVFADPRTCQLQNPVGSYESKESTAGPGLRFVSREAVDQFKQRLQVLTPSVIQAIFRIARFGNMQPELRDSAPGETIFDKQNFVINQWTQALMRRIQEIQNSQCPSRP